MSPFPRPDYESLDRYRIDRTPVEVDLSDNTNHWGAHPDALEVVWRADWDTLGRYPEPYAASLRGAVSKRLGVPAECVTTGCGADDVLDCAYRSSGHTGNTVAFCVPTFSMADYLARMNGFGTDAVSWANALDDPGRLFRNDPSLLYVCRPNNPTGHVVPLDWLEGVLKLAAESSVLVVVDEAYAEFADHSLVERAVERPRLLVTRTLSKAFGLAGLRVGYGIGTPDTALEIEKARGPFKVGRVAGEAAVAALNDESGWLRGTLKEARANRERLTTALEERGLEPLESHANFVLFKAPGPAAQDDARALRRRSVAVRPFADAHPRGEALRVTVAPWPILERFLRALDARVAELRVARVDRGEADGTGTIPLGAPEDGPE